MKKISIIIVTLIALVTFFSSCSTSSERVVIYTCLEDFRNQELQSQLNDKFEDMEVILYYQSTGKNAAKVKLEGANTPCDIVLGMDSSYSNMLNDCYAPIPDYDQSHYMEDMQTVGKNYLTWERYGCAVVVNTEFLEKRGLEKPTCYEDLLKEEYKNMIVMPDPKSSSTGYILVNHLVDVMGGEEEAFAYFDELTKNVLQFTSSGSAPINMLVQNEIGIGLSLTFTAVNKLNEGVPLEILYFDEGSPYSYSTFAMIKGKEDDENVRKVFDFLYNDFVRYDKEHFSPELIFKDQEIVVDNFPKNINYATMNDIDSIEYRDHLLGQWRY